MARAKRPQLSSKKQPKQARSRQLVAAILEGAVRVLATEGARGFTTVRVAETAGVSVGSLYQYFPNKEALLFRLQAEEWAQTMAILRALLNDPTRPPLDRYREMVVAFFRTEREEAALRGALHDAGALIRDAPETREHRKASARLMLAFMAEALPGVSAKKRAFAADFIGTSLSAVSEKITREAMPRSELDAWARATAEMHCAWLAQLRTA